MPFVATLELDKPDCQLYLVDIENVDQERERLAIAFSKDGQTGDLAFKLVTGPSGENRLLLDRENCTGYAVDDLVKTLNAIPRVLRARDGDDVYLGTEEFSTTELTLKLPVVLVKSTHVRKVHLFDIISRLKLEDGETVTVESRTLD